ncbi:ATP-binding protein [Thermoproteota archaeon]
MENNINIVVLDDEKNILHSLERTFRSEPYGVYTTSDPQDALKKIGEENVKVVMSDQRMPTISGVDFLKKVKERHPDVIRILFTGYTDIKIAEDAINKDEVYRFINKPWDEDHLKAIIKDAIGRFDLQEEKRQLTEELKNKNDDLVVINTKLENMYEAQKAFSSTVSHELKTPLASIKMAIDIILSGTSGALTDQQKDFLDKAKTNVDRLARLVQDILDLTKLESGRTVLKIEENDMNATIKEVVDIQRSVAEKRDLYLNLNLDENMPKVLFDNDKINQVLHNLVSNAIKFTENGGITISSSVHAEGNHIEVCVKDTGCGIKDDDIPKLFKKFHQLADPKKQNTGGTGLGLAICKEIIAQHGGKVWMESELGKGSSFYFLLPIKERRHEDRE